MTPGEWTVATVREYLIELVASNDKRYEQRFRDSQVAVDAALNAAKEAVTKAEAASEKRFEGVNEFRGQLADQQRTFIPRTEAEFRIHALEARLSALESGSTERRGQRTGMKDSWGLLAGVAALLIALISIALRFMSS